MSNWARSAGEKADSADVRTKSTPDSPGPPGFVTRSPILVAGFVAGRRIRASSIDPFVGWS